MNSHLWAELERLAARITDLERRRQMIETSGHLVAAQELARQIAEAEAARRSLTERLCVQLVEKAAA